MTTTYTTVHSNVIVWIHSVTFLYSCEKGGEFIETRLYILFLIIIVPRQMKLQQTLYVIYTVTFLYSYENGGEII
jgi:hypothetical protein